MINFKQHPLLRKFYVSLRDTWLLFKQFQWSIGAFIIAIFGGGLLYYGLANTADESINPSSESIYHILSLTFLQPFEDFPQAWYFQSFYLIVPIIRVGILVWVWPILVSCFSTDMSAVLLRCCGKMPDYHPSASRQIVPNDTLAIFGCSTQISVLAGINLSYE